MKCIKAICIETAWQLFWPVTHNDICAQIHYRPYEFTGTAELLVNVCFHCYYWTVQYRYMILLVTVHVFNELVTHCCRNIDCPVIGVSFVFDKITVGLVFTPRAIKTRHCIFDYSLLHVKIKVNF